MQCIKIFATINLNHIATVGATIDYVGLILTSKKRGIILARL